MTPEEFKAVEETKARLMPILEQMNGLTNMELASLVSTIIARIAEGAAEPAFSVWFTLVIRGAFKNLEMKNSIGLAISRSADKREGLN